MNVTKDLDPKTEIFVRDFPRCYNFFMKEVWMLQFASDLALGVKDETSSSELNKEADELLKAFNKLIEHYTKDLFE